MVGQRTCVQIHSMSRTLSQMQKIHSYQLPHDQNLQLVQSTVQRDESTKSRGYSDESTMTRVQCESAVRKCSARVQCDGEYNAGDREPRLQRDESTPRPLTLSRVERAPAHSDRCLQVGASGCPRRFARRLICGRIVEAAASPR